MCPRKMFDIFQIHFENFGFVYLIDLFDDYLITFAIVKLF